MSELFLLWGRNSSSTLTFFFLSIFFKGGGEGSFWDFLKVLTLFRAFLGRSSKKHPVWLIIMSTQLWMSLIDRVPVLTHGYDLGRRRIHVQHRGKLVLDVEETDCEINKEIIIYQQCCRAISSLVVGLDAVPPSFVVIRDIFLFALWINKLVNEPCIWGQFWFQNQLILREWIVGKA